MTVTKVEGKTKPLLASGFAGAQAHAVETRGKLHSGATRLCTFSSAFDRRLRRRLRLRDLLLAFKLVP